jgi:oligoendopeptidase F
MMRRNEILACGIFASSRRRKVVDEALGRGDSDRSFYLLKQAGIDMATPDPYQALIRMNHQLDELEELLKHKN